MIALAQQDSRIVAITAAMPEGTGLTRFGEAFPERFFDVGIAEQHGVTFAAGMATEGLKPVVAIYSTFLQRAYDQIVHDVCIDGHAVVFAIDRGGIVGNDGPTHHGVFDLSYLRSLPNMVVMSPKDGYELQRMLVTAIGHDGPIAVRYPRGEAIGRAPQESADIPALTIGKAEVLREGDDVLILAIGHMVQDALTAAATLASEGIAATVVNARFVKPLDRDLICPLAERIGRVVTVEENVCQGGFGSAVLECLAEAGVCVAGLRMVGVPDAFVEHGAQKILRAKYGIDSQGIVEAVRRLLPKKP